MNGLEKIKKHPILLFLIALFFLIIIPFGINFLFKWYAGPMLKWESDAGSILEFYGAVLGGGITLLVLWITTDETRKIQKKNEQQLEDDKKEREREKRKAFADSVAEDISKFVAETTVFADKYRNFDKALKNKTENEVALQIIIKKIVDNTNEMAEKDDADLKYAARDTELTQEKEEILRRIEVCERHMEMLYIDSSRIGAIERFTALSLKLRGMKWEDEILDKMNEINAVAANASIEFEKLGVLHEELLCYVDAFAKEYIEKG